MEVPIGKAAGGPFATAVTFDLHCSSSISSLLRQVAEAHERELEAVRSQMRTELEGVWKERLSMAPVSNQALSSNGNGDDQVPHSGFTSPREPPAPPGVQQPQQETPAEPPVPPKRKRRSFAASEGFNDGLALIKGWKTDNTNIYMNPRKPPKKYGWVRTQARWLVHNQFFDALCATMIVVSAALLGLQVSYVGETRANPENLPATYDIINRWFTGYFLVELLLRIVAEGHGFLRGRERFWNVFDVVVVSSDVVDTIVGFATEAGGQSQTKVLRVLRVARITRAIRVVRMVRFFRELRMMVFSVLMSGGSLVWSMLLFFVILYMFGMYFCQMVLYHLSDNNFQPAGRLSQTDVDHLLEDWGSLPHGWYTLFRCMTGGISWGDVAKPLINIHWVHLLALVLFMFFTIFVVTNIITGIFVDTAIQSAQSDRDQVIQDQMHAKNSAVKMMQEVFLDVDEDGSGMISFQEFDKLLKEKEEVRVYLSSLGLDVDEALGLFKLLDTDGSETVGIEEFVHGCMRLKGGAKSIDLATLMYENKRLMERFENFFQFVKDNFYRLEEFEGRVENSLEVLSSNPDGLAAPVRSQVLALMGSSRGPLVLPSSPPQRASAPASQPHHHNYSYVQAGGDTPVEDDSRADGSSTPMRSSTANTGKEAVDKLFTGNASRAPHLSANAL